MKRFKLYKAILTMLFAGSMHFALAYEEKIKLIEKTHEVSTSTLFKLTNSYGSIHIETWDQSVIEVKVEVVARARTEKRAQEMLDRIDIDIEEGSSRIFYETDLSGSWGRNDNKFEINYEVKMPTINPIDIENKYGDTYIATREGESRIEIGYGKLKTDDLLGSTELDLAYGSADIGIMGDAFLDIAYSRLLIESMNESDIKQRYAQIEIDKVEHVDLESRYGNIRFGEVGEAKVDAHYSGFKIDELSGSLDMEASYVSGFDIGTLRTSFSSVEIYGKYSGMKIGLEEGLKADIDARFSYSNLRSYDEIEFHYKSKESNKAEYRGKIGGGDPSKKIVVRSSYGDLRIY